MSDLERRFAGECRVEVGSDDRRIRGTAIVFNSRSVNLGGFREIIKPEAVDRTLREALDVHAFWNHDSGEVLGRTIAGTLQLRKDTRGLSVVIDPPSWADKLLESIRRGDVSGMSFGFRTIEDDWRMEDGEPLREVTDMEIAEVSIVSKPAYPATDVMVSKRSLDALREFKQAHRWTKAETDRRLKLSR